MPPEQMSDSAKLTTILNGVNDIKVIAQDIAVLQTQHISMEKEQDEIKSDIKNLYEKKASKTDLKNGLDAVSGVMVEHKNDHRSYNAAVVGAIITGVAAIIIAVIVAFVKGGSV